MQTPARSLRTSAIVGIALTAWMPTPSLRLQQPVEAAGPRDADEDLPFDAPPAIREEHRHLHAALEAAADAGGKTGAAAAALQRVLADHFGEEQRTAMPPLGLLRELVDGPPTDAMRPAVELADRVLANLPRYREEHRAIEAALRKLATAARDEDHPEHARFAEQLVLHAQLEEQVLYPATILVGKYLRAHPSAGAPTATDGAPRLLAATLRPINRKANDGDAVHGTALFVWSADTLTVHVRATGLAPGVAHRQMVHVGGACPDAEADRNGDGVVDVHEGLPAYGKVLVPLDSDLSSAGAGEYPEADQRGELRYTATISGDALRAAVGGPDPDPDDPLVRLGADEELDLAGRTVVLHGVAAATDLPDSVRGIAGVAPHRTVPVACGVIEAVR